MKSLSSIVGYGTNDTNPVLAKQWVQIADWAVLNSCTLRGLFADLSAKASTVHHDLEKAVNLALETRSKFVVYSVENLTTSSMKVIKLMRLFLKTGVTFISLNDQFHISDTGVGTLSLVISALDNLNTTLNEKRFSSLKLAREYGSRQHIPYGMEKIGLSTIPSSGEMRVVEKIIRLRRDRRSYRFIANQLTKWDIPTRRRTKWHPKVVMSIYKRYEDERMKKDGMEKNSNGTYQPKVLRAKDRIKLAAFEIVQSYIRLKLADTLKVNEFFSGTEIH